MKIVIDITHIDKNTEFSNVLECKMLLIPEKFENLWDRVPSSKTVSENNYVETDCLFLYLFILVLLLNACFAFLFIFYSTIFIIKAVIKPHNAHSITILIFLFHSKCVCFYRSYVRR